jgi:co-chaperonin GroES (HSP10)
MALNPIKLKSVKPIRDHVIVTEMEFEQRLVNNIILLADNGKSQGVRPRWGKVYAIGHEQKDIKVGQWILIDHGRWTRGVKIETPDGQIHTIRRIDHKDILMVADHKPSDETVKSGISSNNE